MTRFTPPASHRERALRARELLIQQALGGGEDNDIAEAIARVLVRNRGAARAEKIGNLISREGWNAAREGV